MSVYYHFDLYSFIFLNNIQKYLVNSTIYQYNLCNNPCIHSDCGNHKIKPLFLSVSHRVNTFQSIRRELYL